ncbi:MAG: DUF3071 domain-containing protein [Rhodoluna sp.]|nr:DUF3071 domain-containing protein [Rhodoluna sp.]
MDDIRLFETDGDFLVLEAQDGQKFRLLIDETVRSSVKREAKPALDDVSISPRAIQDEIRNGASIEDLMTQSGASFEFIEKFAAPVIAELNHVVSSALSVRLTIAGDRYNDSTQIEFGEIIGGRLVTSGATGISWLAKKIDVNNWHVIANYSLNGTIGSATWAFDPRRLTLSPESETAVTLSSQETISNTPIPKLRNVQLTDSVAPVEQNTAPSDTLARTEVFDDVIPIGRGMQNETPISRAFEEDRPEPSTPAAFLKNASDKEVRTAEPLSATADLLEALRRKRTEREVTDLESHPETTQIRVVDIEVPKVQEPEASSDEPKEPVPETSTAPKKGRAAMPSWDEIVFGTKTDD